MLCGKAGELAGSRCISCNCPCEITTKPAECTVVIMMKCTAGHLLTWSSSPNIRNANAHAIYKFNLVFASLLLFSGNNYKIQQFFKFMNVSVIGPSTYFGYQQLCLCPVISNFYVNKIVHMLGDIIFYRFI